MSKAQKYAQKMKEQKAAAKNKSNSLMPKLVDPSASSGQQKTLKERQAENKEALRKHQASMTRLKAFEEKLHPTPAGAAPASEKSALDSMFYDGSNLTKDQGRTSHVVAKDSPGQPTRAVTHTGEPVKHEGETTIKPAPAH